MPTSGLYGPQAEQIEEANAVPLRPQGQSQDVDIPDDSAQTMPAQVKSKKATAASFEPPPQVLRGLGINREVG